ncbi:MAG TPA: SMC-Scp complex subunit ScpB [Desulfomonilia bacterium]|nr:SMC-Scp complex subunit ScpB [Desulfomonilia bacterium]
MRNREIIEALIFSSGSALSARDIMKILPGSSREEIERCVEELNGIYEASNRSFRIHLVATGYMFVTLSEYASYLRQLVTPVRLTSASLEVLAIIAYKGPCSKQTIDGVRGVDSSSSLKQLIKHQLIDIKSGKPMMYYTTDKFLEVFGLTSLNDLPDITQFEEVFGGG